jgi:hypothetical protein
MSDQTDLYEKGHKLMEEMVEAQLHVRDWQLAINQKADEFQNLPDSVKEKLFICQGKAYSFAGKISEPAKCRGHVFISRDISQKLCDPAPSKS